VAQAPPVGGGKTIDGFSKVLHNRFICSVAGDLKISEVVDIPNWVVSMTVPQGIFE
jgi:acetamidase/formamidase